ncbi:hypothetical protein EPA93_39600 [Ktedonosporobacter rubrisoli]|uniref:Glycoside hydrolase family 5 domain-containing protein n=1 Tax=Ktedonosporobacter rubrisoli TaxID=2509675 RepID=A0A4P6K198_KTERU|nr:cellulase family glycosylhydrolase [Ktedonosporobacter rubrisoli]QBD81755.1 hypothetical protein EPA93_39600 [Ktedonosporobacter rubrisoli]
MKRRLVLIGLVVLIIVGGVVAYAGWINHNVNPPEVRETPQPVPPAGHAPGQDKGCGITRTGTGYTFSWLHVSSGFIMDDKNCIVTLKGFNWSQLEFGNGIGGSQKTRISEDALAWYNQTFQMNVWRIPLNATWWNQNVEVPLAGMRYQDWIQQVVKWSEENGNYVILTKGPQFADPPCGKGIKLCPTQNQGQKDIMHGTAGPEVQTTGRYIDPALTMWSSVARLYANDPAVLYDSWNEMQGIDDQTWWTNTNKLISAIRAENPHSLIFLGGPNFKGNVNALVQGTVPDFAQPDLVYDFHVYDGFKGAYQSKKCNSPLSYIWQDWPAHADEQVGFAQQHGKAVIFSEWGGCNDLDNYHQAIIDYARIHHVSLAYYDETNVAIRSNGTYQLTENGLKVQAAYATL